MKSYVRLGLVALVVLAVCMPAAAQDGTAASATEGHDFARALAIIGACIAAGIAAIGGGYGIARVGSACIDSIARQPEAAGAMFAPMIITAAMIEGGMLFAIVVCLLGVLFV